MVPERSERASRLSAYLKHHRHAARHLPGWPLRPGGVKGVAIGLLFANDGRLVGAGTVLDAPTGRAAILAGARFLVSPAVIPEVIVTGHRYGVPVLPGAQTPIEIQRALEAGSDMVKVFPASQLGPGFISAVRAALPQAPLVPTGGITAGHAASWLTAGAVAVGVGGSLTSGGPAQASERAAELLAALDNVRLGETP